MRACTLVRLLSARSVRRLTEVSGESPSQHTMELSMRTGVILESNDGALAWAPESDRLRNIHVDGEERLFYKFAGDGKFAAFIGFKQAPHPFNR